jgi:hypothetical protein
VPRRGSARVILPSIPLTVLVGLGAQWILERAESLRMRAARPKLAAVGAGAALLAAPAAAAVTHYAGDDQAGNYVAQSYGEDCSRRWPGARCS